MILMSYQETTDYSFLLGNNHFIYNHSEDENTLHLYVKSRPHSCKCPLCGTESRSLHATYERILQDTPIHCKQTFLHVTAYKYECKNPACSGTVFMEPLPFAKASQVRTDALNSLILGVSMFLSNEGASKVLALLGVTVSNDTIQRLYDRITFIDDPNVEEVGIDDVAIRKGQTYATAVYDLKDHHLIALLEGRDAETLKEWLKKHNKIRLVTRDRASAYAAAISAVLPDCIQVADRFHLLQNLLGHLKDIFKTEMPGTVYLKDGQVLSHTPEKILTEKEPDHAYLATLEYDDTPPKNPDGSELVYDNKRHYLTSGEYRKLDEKRKKTAADP
ncbi:MAG: ISL3 family transposase [Lachnospiraceae bacterium]|nr:ISL3 family transposase [Lachnospiraceae bacterium]